FLFVNCSTWICFFFFFQAEDGIRDFHVTGVQTCALPILDGLVEQEGVGRRQVPLQVVALTHDEGDPAQQILVTFPGLIPEYPGRSEERRVGKEWRSQWSP